MIRLVLTGLVLMGLAGTSAAQDVFDDGGGTETRFAAEAAIALASDEGEAVYALTLDGGISHVLQSGVEIGVSGIFGLQADAAGRPGFVASLPADVASSNGFSGAFSGFGRGGPTLDTGPRGALEAAYVFASGGYGEVRLGRDAGVAKRFAEAGPSLFTAARLANPALDPTGAAFIRTDHDLTGPAAKISYATPRLVGVRAGVSFTLEADVRGLDRDPAGNIAGIATPVIENAVEAGLNISRRLPQSGVRLRGGLAFSRADAASTLRPGEYGTIETWSGGGTAAFGALEIGASTLTSNNGVSGRPADYHAWSVSALNRFEAFEAGVSLGGAEDDLAGLESRAWSAGIARKMNGNARLAAAWREQETRLSGLVPGAGIPSKATSRGIVIEITLSR